MVEQEFGSKGHSAYQREGPTTRTCWTLGTLVATGETEAASAEQFGRNAPTAVLVLLPPGSGCRSLR